MSSGKSKRDRGEHVPPEESVHTPGPATVRVGGDTYASIETFTAAEVAVLKVLALAAEVNRKNRDERGVRLSNETRGVREQPWAFKVHSRTAQRLSDRGLVETRFARKWPGDLDLIAMLTPTGEAASAAIAKAEGRDE